MFFKINKTDENGNILTGYEQVQENNSKSEAISDYLTWLDDGTTENEVDVQVKEGENWIDA